MLALSLVAGLALSVAQSSPASSSLIFFRTPSRNINCLATFEHAPSLRCDINSGVKPLPPRPASCDFDWGAGYFLDRTGRARVSCVSDAAASPTAKVVAYGTTWRRAPFTCTSKRIGLRCTNASGHGFFLSRAHSYRF